MTKAQVIAQIAEQTGIDPRDISAVLEAYFAVVKDSLALGEPIVVRGFGRFKLKRRARKVARHITRNTAVMVEEHSIPAFQPSKEFVRLVKESVKSEE